MDNYQRLAEEIQDMWQQDKVIVVPVIISSTRVVRTFIKAQNTCN
jgi:hypothetical protein